MVLVVVERRLAEPADMADLGEREGSVGWCFEAHGVQSVASFVASDQRDLLCIYEAPDAEAVRKVQTEAELPFSAVWSAECLGELPEGDPQRETVAVLRVHSTPITVGDVLAASERANGCLKLYRVKTAASFLAASGRRQLCLFSAPDTEAVRVANRESKLSSERIFRVDIHLPTRPGER